jgi:hypothetical protein
MITFKHRIATELSLFLGPKERSKLEDLAAGYNDWERGRQGDEYFKLDLMEHLICNEEAWLQDLVTRCLGAIQAHDGGRPWDRAPKHDLWLLFYPGGGGVRWHKDPALPGLKHVRLNAVIKAGEGGDLLVRPEPKISGCREYQGEAERYRLAAGQAVVFEPSRFEHAVSPVLQGERLVLSVGTFLPV